MSNFEKIILSATGLLIAIVLVFGIVIFRQQKDITALKAGSATGTSGQAGASSQIPSQNLKNIDSDPMPGVMKQFSGKITGISENQLTVDIKLPDLSKPKNPNGSAGENNGTIDKKITVNASEKTVFEKKTLADLKTGDSIFIFSYDSVYLSDTVKAEKITYIGLPK
jgi:hypothetical protein